MVDEVSDQWFIDNFESRGSRMRGAYLECIRNWLSVFPEARLYLIVLDDLQQDPRRVLLQLAAHVGIDEAPFASADDHMLRMPIFEGSHLTVRPALLEHLRRIYTGEIEALGKQVGRNFACWIEWDGCP